MKYTFFLLLLIMTGCYATKPAEPELNMLTHDVLKTKEGIQIQIIPVDKADLKHQK